jgi:hypothetical protein
MKNIFTYFLLISILVSWNISVADARVFLDNGEADIEAIDVASVLVPHKALYDIKLVATRSGAQVVNISGKMFYEWKPTCDAWITDHRFNLFYEYADSPAMKITSDFSTFETFDGESFSFSARRKRDNNLYQELRGRATVADKGGEVDFTMPNDLSFELAQGSMFPMGHTVEMVRQALAGKKLFQAIVFDGSDDEGPVEINSFIGRPVNAMQKIEPSENLDMSLLNNKAWNVRMAVFPLLNNEEASSDYEMDMIFHENGVISDMLIEYDNFSVTQKLIALEPVHAESCGNKHRSEEKNQ